jgi:hypothetical protein
LPGARPAAFAGTCLDVAGRVSHASVAVAVVSVIEVKLLTLKHRLTTTRARFAYRISHERST